MQSSNLIELGIEGKELYLKFTGMVIPIKLGTYQDIRNMSSQDTIKVGDNEIQMPQMVKSIGYNITDEILLLIDKMTDDEFFNDIYKDIKEDSDNGLLTLIGVFNEWD